MIPRTEISIDTITPALQALASRGQDLGALMARFGAALVTEVKLGFTSSRSPYGAVWAALKLRQGQPLRDKGHLMNSITYSADARSVTIGPGFGPSSKGAALQQFGGTVEAKPGKFLVFKPTGSNRLIFARKVTVPAREYLPTAQGGLPRPWREVILQEIGAYLMEGTPA